MPIWPLSRQPLARMATMRRTSAEIATVIKAGSAATRAQVPIGAARNVATQTGRTTGRSARRIASGNSWNTAGNPITLLTAIAACGPSTKLNTGTEINAAPNPTKPRNRPATVTAIKTATNRPSTGTPSSSDTQSKVPRPEAHGYVEDYALSRTVVSHGTLIARPAACVENHSSSGPLDVGRRWSRLSVTCAFCTSTLRLLHLEGITTAPHQHARLFQSDQKSVRCRPITPSPQPSPSPRPN